MRSYGRFCGVINRSHIHVLQNTMLSTSVFCNIEGVNLSRVYSKHMVTLVLWDSVVRSTSSRVIENELPGWIAIIGDASVNDIHNFCVVRRFIT